MQKRILILCEAIAPPAYSPRVLTLVEWLQANGWECEIVTEECKEKAFEWDICTVYQMPAYEHIVADKLLYGKDKALCRFAEKVVDIGSFNLIFCSSYYYFPLYAAYLLAKKYRIPLAIDLRDIAEQWGEEAYFTRQLTPFKKLNYWLGKIYEHRQLRIRNKILRAANMVTSVSPWHKDWLMQYNPKTYLVYNGYDANVFVPKDVQSERFNISYLGKLYSTKLRDPRLLFAALRELVADGEISKEDVKVVFHIDTKGCEEIEKLGREYDIIDLMEVSGYLPRGEILPIMYASSILLVLTTQSTPRGTHGIMGTKFFENIGIEKPILCVRSDEECLADAIEHTNAGLAATQVEEVKAFIVEKYHEWRTKGYTHQEVRNKEQFTRQQEAQDFEKLFLECIK